MADLLNELYCPLSLKGIATSLTNALGVDSPKSAEPALDIMNTNYNRNDLSVEKLSGLCGISVAYFRRLFTEKYGTSPKEYIINRRIEYAKKLLESKQFHVSEVAEMCGYSEPCHFSREFKKHVKISPAEFKGE